MSLSAAQVGAIRERHDAMAIMRSHVARKTTGLVVKCGHGLCCLRWFVVRLLVVQFAQELFPGRVPRRCWRTSPAPAGAPETTTTTTATTTTVRRRSRTAFTVTTNAAFLGAPTPR